MNARFLYKKDGYPFNALEVKPNKATKKWLLMFLGSGELGPEDASQIGDLDNYGYQRNLGFETDFNILVPQAVKGYNEFEFTILPWMVKTYGEDIEIVLTGHSLGARQVMEYVNRYRGLDIVPQVKGFMPVAGEMSGPYPTDPCTCVDLPILAVHGDKDSAINKVQSEKFVKLVNSCATRKHKALLKIVPGASHGSVMSEVFKYDRTSEYYQFIMSCWSKEKEPVKCEAILDEANGIATFFLPEGEKTFLILPTR
jgi:hypothetical protein